MYSTFEHRNRQIAQKLSRKLDESLTAMPEKQDVLEPRSTDLKYRDVAEKLRILRTKNQRNQIMIKQDVERVEDVLFRIEKTKNISGDLPGQLFENFDKLVQAEQLSNTEKMAIIKKGMIEDIDKKKRAMKTDAIQILQQQFSQSCKTKLSEVQKKLSTLSLLLEQQKTNRQESASMLAQSIGEEILKMEHLIAEERQLRKNQTSGILELLGEIEDKLDIGVCQENKFREKAEMEMDGMLEEVCERIQRKIIGA